LFLGCESFDSVWHFVLQLLGISTINQVDVLEHAVQFGGSNGSKKDNRVGLQVACGWLLFGFFKGAQCKNFLKRRVNVS